MADKKISALPAATTPLAGTEVLPVVQGGATDQVSVANLTAGRTVNAGALNVNVASAYGSSKLSVNGDFTLADSMGLCWGTNATSFTGLLGNRSTGNVSIYTGGTERYTTDANGNLAVKTAAKGVNFTANTPAAGMTSQLLNWYEEGTWTPVLVGFNPSGVITLTGTFTRIGRFVYASCHIETNSGYITPVSGTSYITGLPYSPTYPSSGGVTSAEENSPYTTAAGRVGPNGYIYVGTTSASYYGNLTVSAVYHIV